MNEIQKINTGTKNKYIYVQIKNEKWFYKPCSLAIRRRNCIIQYNFIICAKTIKNGTNLCVQTRSKFLIYINK